jgi:predicted RecB family nuclease
MQRLDGRLLLSATDLSDFLACEHLALLKRRVADGEELPEDPGALAEQLAAMGAEHEQACLTAYRSRLPRVIEFDDSRTRDARSLAELEAAAAETEVAMRDGHDVIYQPFFLHDGWLGRADFLLRVPLPSALGDFSYEVADAKLARRVRPQAILQLCEYSQHVRRIQGVAPHDIHVLLGSGEDRVYPLADFAAYHRVVRERLRAAVDEGFWPTYPEKVSHCDMCRFKLRCDARRHADDHLSIVARMRRDQVRKLNAAGIATVAQLAALPASVDIAQLQGSSLATLREQARLQHEGPLPDGRPRHELLDVFDAGFGLCALPEPSPGDVFFDMEGDPLARDHPLEYLFGVVHRDAGGEVRYRCWQGHEPAEERAAFEEFVDWIMERRGAHPGMHVYHYADYERAALQRLMSRHGTRENEVDTLLRDGVLVDLYRVVHQGVRLSTETYGLKAVEHLYMPPRNDAVADAMSSVLMYERWRGSGATPATRRRELLDDIIEYNRVDCESTLFLREWLEAQRVALEERRDAPLPRPPLRQPAEEPKTVEQTAAEEALRRSLVEGIAEDPDERRTESDRGRWLLGQLIGYHNRERKSQWWRYFSKLDLTEDQLADDRDALGPLRHFATVEHFDNGATLERYSFDPQEHHLGDVVHDPMLTSTDGRRGVATGSVERIDDVEGTIDLRRAPKQAQLPHPLFLVPGFPFGTDAQSAALSALGAAVVTDGLESITGWDTGRALLLRRAPGDGGALRRSGEDVVSAASRLLRHEGVCLAVQGPPGSGKTYAGARVAADRCRHGVVAVTSVSHRAISALLEAISRADPSLRIGQRAPTAELCTTDALVVLGDNQAATRALDDDTVDVIGGTSWLFSREELADRFDTLIVDEAGQTSLADVIAMSRCARRLVLLGDPRQLAQVVQGIHPDGAAASALEHFLGDDVTMPADRGLFLEATRRMCSELCTFVSDTFYESRLQPDACCATRHIQTPAGPLAGIRRCPVPHDGDRVSSEAEATAVRAIVDSLLGCAVVDADGSTHELTVRDIVVVAPYNAHVACLVRAVPAGVKVGTVDKFQGQEAAVSIFSMATSSTDDLPRNLEFLFSMNRLNVALSRASCLAVVVHSPALLTAHCRSAEQMRLVNALCRFTQAAPVWEHTEANQLVLVP